MEKRKQTTADAHEEFRRAASTLLAELRQAGAPTFFVGVWVGMLVMLVATLLT